MQDDNNGQVLQDRVAKVKPFWESASQETRLDLLSIPLCELKQRAAEVGARQRQERGGQAASQCHLSPAFQPGAVGQLSGQSQAANSSAGRQAAEQGGQAGLRTGTLCGPSASSRFPATALSAAQATSWNDFSGQNVLKSKMQRIGVGFTAALHCAWHVTGLQLLARPGCLAQLRGFWASLHWHKA